MNNMVDGDWKKDRIIFTPLNLYMEYILLSYNNYLKDHLDDEGYMYNNGNQSIQKGRIQFKYIVKQLISIVLGIFVLVTGFVNDAYYYGASIVMLCMIIWSFYDLTKEHNLIVSTKLPQLEKRGGNEDE